MQAAGGCKLFVGNLAWTTDSGCLQSTFSQFGQVLDAVVMQDHQTGRSRGFGFITFSQQSEADAAIQGLNDFQIGGRSVRVNYAHHQAGGGGGQRSGGGGYHGGGGGGYHNQASANAQDGGGGGGGWGGGDMAGNRYSGSNGYGNQQQQRYDNGGGYGGGYRNQDTWRGQQNNYNSSNSGW